MSSAIILHLSDLHIRQTDADLSSRFQRLLRAIVSYKQTAKVCIVVISGDVVSTGQKGEFDLSLRLFRDFKTLALDHFERVEVIVVPGNHDCCFNEQKQMRSIVLKQLCSDQSTPIDEEIIETCTAPLSNFYDFADDLLAESYSRALSFQRAIDVSGHKIEFLCLNTAWMSQRKEVQGTLRLPLATFSPSTGSDAVKISVFHHPYNWLRATESREFRREIEKHSHIILMC